MEYLIDLAESDEVLGTLSQILMSLCLTLPVTQTLNSRVLRGRRSSVKGQPSPSKLLHRYILLLNPRRVLTMRTQTHANGSASFCVTDVQGVEIPYMGLFSTCASGVSAEVKFRMFGYILVPRLKPIPLSWSVVVVETPPSDAETFLTQPAQWSLLSSQHRFDGSPFFKQLSSVP